MESWASFKVSGQKLHGMVHIPETPKPDSGFPAVVMLHGWTGSRSSDHRLFVLLSRYLMGLGIASLRFDFRGSGESEGDYSEMTLSREVEDAQEALNYLRDLPEIDSSRVSLFGFSMGGLVAALTAPIAKPYKVLLLAPATPEIMLKRMPHGQIPPTIFDYGGWPVGRAFWLELPELDPLEAIRKYKNPVRVIHGDQDQAVPIEMGERYASASSGEMVRILGAGHTFDSLVWVEELFKQVSWFLLER